MTVFQNLSFADRITLSRTTDCMFENNYFSHSIYTYFQGSGAYDIELLLQVQKEKEQQAFNRMKLLNIFKLGNKTFLCVVTCLLNQRGNLTLTFKTQPSDIPSICMARIANK